VSDWTFDLELDLPISAAFRVAAGRVEEGISNHCEAEIEIACNEDVNFEPALLGQAAVRIVVNGDVARRFSLKVAKVAFSRIESGSRRWIVSLRDALWFLRFTRSIRKFRNTNTKEIVSTILREGGVEASFQLTRAETWPRNYCVQYRETNLDYVLRLLEFEGIYYHFDEDGALLLGDRSQASPPVEGTSHFELLTSAGAMSDSEPGIYAFRRGAKVAAGKATVHDYDWKKPSADLRRSAEAAEFQDLENYASPAGYRDEAEGAFLAQIRLEALRVPARFFEGRSSVPAFAPARVFTFGSAAGDAFAGDYLLTHVAHEYRDPRFFEQPGAPSYSNTFRAIPRDVPFRPPLATARPTIGGVHTAMVRGPAGEEIHTNRYGQFKAQFHWDREAKSNDEDSRWVRVLQESAASMTLARVGWEMSVAYIDGDPERPIGLARNINGVMLPTYGQPANRSMMAIKTQSYPGGGGYNELRMEDAASRMSFDIRAQRDMAGVVRNDRVERIGNDHRTVCKALYTHGVGRNQSVFIGANSTTTCTGIHGTIVAGGRSKSVGGNETVRAEGTGAERRDANDTEDVGVDRNTTAETGIGRTVKRTLTRTIDADYTINAGGAVECNMGLLTETITGSKTTTAEGAIQQAITGPHSVQIGGSMTRSGSGGVGASAKATTISVGGSATMAADKKVTLHGEVVELVAENKLGLSAGGLSIELAPSGVTVKGTVKLDAGTKIIVTGNPDNITK
jgi:type VI secretion system secreted protein VgrG